MSTAQTRLGSFSANSAPPATGTDSSLAVPKPAARTAHWHCGPLLVPEPPRNAGIISTVGTPSRVVEPRALGRSRRTRKGRWGARLRTRRALVGGAAGIVAKDLILQGAVAAGWARYDLWGVLARPFLGGAPVPFASWAVGGAMVPFTAPWLFPTPGSRAPGAAESDDEERSRRPAGKLRRTAWRQRCSRRR